MQSQPPSTMRAMVLIGPGRYELQDVPVPQPGLGEVLCKIGSVSIGNADPHIIQGDHAGVWPPSYPFIAGNAWAGRVVQLGQNVTKFKLGDRVAGDSQKGCGFCHNCLQGLYHLCENYGNASSGQRHYGYTSPGAYCQYQVYDLRALSPLPDSVSYLEGSLTGLGGAVLHAMEKAEIAAGCSVAVIGSGALGRMAMRVARAMGAGDLFVVDRGMRLDTGGQPRCQVVDYTLADPAEEVRLLSGGLGVDLCLECSGARGAVPQGIRMLRKGGKLALLGSVMEEAAEEVSFRLITQNEITLIGCHSGPNTGEKILRMMSTGVLKVRDLATHTYSLEDIGQALDLYMQRRDGVIKAVVYPNGGEDM